MVRMGHVVRQGEPSLQTGRGRQTNHEELDVTTVNVLGRLTVATADGDRPALPPQQRKLMALLALRPGQQVDREWLAHGMWGSSGAAHLRSLQVHVSHVRAALGRDTIESVDQGYRLIVDPDDVDEVRFRALVADGQEAVTQGNFDDALTLLEEALDLWRGDPYAELDGEEVRAQRAGLHELLFAAQDAVVRARVELIRTPNDAESVVPLSAHRLAEQPFREGRVLPHMRCLMAAGRLTDAVNAAADFRQRVLHETGVEPGPDFVEATTRIMSRHPALLPAAWQSRVDVPAHSTPLLQRDSAHELAVSLLKWGSVRLLSVTGEPGVGKTRLVAAVAETLGQGLPGGVIWLGRDQLGTSETALAYVGEAVGVRGNPGELRRLVPAALARRRTLVVLDGIEGDGVLPCVAVLLTAGPALSIMTTGLRPLGLASGHELRLHALSDREAREFVIGLVEAMGASTIALDDEAMADARGLPLLLEHVAIDVLSEVVRA